MKNKAVVLLPTDL